MCITWLPWVVFIACSHGQHVGFIAFVAYEVDQMAWVPATDEFAGSACARECVRQGEAAHDVASTNLQ